MPPEILAAVLGAVFSIVGWLLKNKDKQQEDALNAHSAQIKLLFEKHDADATALQELRVQIASNHYERPELDKKFDKLETTFRDGFKDLGEKFDKLSDALTTHMRSVAK